MSKFGKIIITNDGAKILTKALIGKKNVEIDYVFASSTQAYDPLTTPLNGYVIEQQRTNITVTNKDNFLDITANIDNQGVEKVYSAKTYGIVANGGTILCLVQDEEPQNINPYKGTMETVSIHWNIQISNSSNFIFTIAQPGFATQSDLDATKEKLETFTRDSGFVMSGDGVDIDNIRKTSNYASSITPFKGVLPRGVEGTWCTLEIRAQSTTNGLQTLHDTNTGATYTRDWTLSKLREWELVHRNYGALKIAGDGSKYSRLSELNVRRVDNFVSVTGKMTTVSSVESGSEFTVAGFIPLYLRPIDDFQNMVSTNDDFEDSLVYDMHIKKNGDLTIDNIRKGYDPDSYYSAPAGTEFKFSGYYPVLPTNI